MAKNKREMSDMEENFVVGLNEEWRMAKPRDPRHDCAYGEKAEDAPRNKRVIDVEEEY